MMKGKQMKTTEACMQALLDKKALIHECGDSPVMLSEGMLCWGDGRPTEMSFNYPEDWYIYEYEEPEWYEDIPKGGVLGKVIGHNRLIVASGYDDECDCFLTPAGTKCMADSFSPLTPEEIRVFLNNAPEEE